MPDFTVGWTCFFIPSSLAAESAFKDTGHETGSGTMMHNAHQCTNSDFAMAYFHWTTQLKEEALNETLNRHNITIQCEDCANSLESAKLGQYSPNRRLQQFIYCKRVVKGFKKANSYFYPHHCRVSNSSCQWEDGKMALARDLTSETWQLMSHRHCLTRKLVK